MIKGFAMSFSKICFFMHFSKFKNVILIFLFVIPNYTFAAIPWPVIISERITYCSDEPDNPCSQAVKYAGTIGLEMITPLMDPAGPSKDRPKWWGIHCKYGNAMTNTPFSDCNWTSDIQHAPSTPQVIIDRYWNLIRGDFYTGDYSFGSHWGAGPGGECRLFGVMYGSQLLTPKGIFNANTVANSGGGVCIKAVPPNYRCEINAPSEIKHTIATIGSKTINASGSINCGSKPKIYIIGGSEIKLAPGLTESLKITVNGNSLLLTSTVNSNRSKPGIYKGTHIINVSPW